MLLAARHGAAAPRLLRFTLPLAPRAACALAAPTPAASAAEICAIFAVDEARALHALPLPAFAAADEEGEEGAEAPAAEAGTQAANGAPAPSPPPRGLWQAEGPPALTATLMTLLPREVHALAVLPAAPGGAAAPVAALAEPDGLRLLTMAGYQPHR